MSDVESPPLEELIPHRGGSILLGASYRLAEAADLEQIEIVVDALCRVRVIVDDPGAVSAFARVDADGDVLPLFVRVETVTISTPRVDVLGGRSGIALLAEGEHTLVFYLGEEEVGHKDVVLGPGSVTEIRP